jgi:DNA-binding NarL/FixJ family response regulator
VCEALRRRPDDVSLLDIGMPGGGIAAAAEIHARLPQITAAVDGGTTGRGGACPAVPPVAA